jgi:hypothetical protein
MTALPLTLPVEQYRPISMNLRRAITWPLESLPRVGEIYLLSFGAGNSTCYRAVTDVHDRIVSLRPIHSTEKATVQK